MRSLPKTVTAIRLWKALAGALMLAACGGGGSASTAGAGGRACTPGAQLACACPGGTQGTQLCKSDGSGLDACTGCVSADAGATCPASARKVYYHDVDQDSYGSITDTQTACESPGADWVLQGGDCDDANADVHPGQTTYFPTPYTIGSSVSFDYDCDGQETQDPAGGPVLAADPTCTGNPQQGPCTGPSGYWATARTGAGVNPYCGSASYGYCMTEENGSNELFCGTSREMTTPPLGCR